MKTLTKSSSFAAGKKTAVGASVTINIIGSEVKAEVLSPVTAAGSASVTAASSSEDRSEALATAMGADMDRYLNKLGKTTEDIENKASDLLEGKYFDESSSGKKKTKTGEKLDRTLNDADNKKDQSDTEQTNSSDANSGKADDPSANASLSSNVLRTQGVSQTSTQGAADSANEGTSDSDVQSSATDSGVGTGSAEGSGESKFQVAAAVGLNITKHRVNVLLDAPITAANISAEANNEANFLTKGTGFAMSMARKGNSIAAGVAVSVDKNESVVTVNDDLTASSGEGEEAETGAISVKASTTQNTTGEYRGLLAAQALAGAVSGADSACSIAASIVVVVDKAKTGVYVNESGKEVTLDGGAIELASYDKSRVAVRSGGVSVSKGSKAGVGAAFALVYARNTVETVVGSNTEILGESLTVSAEKAVVSFDDFESAVGAATFLTDTSKLSDEEKEEADKGIVNLDKREGDETYKVEINASTDTALGLVDALNVLSSTNYYVEAIAGSIMTGGGNSSTASVAGSIALLLFKNTVQALLGDNVKVTLTGSDENSGMELTASDDANIRVLAGSVSAAPSKVGVGATVAWLDNKDEVNASVGSGSDISIENGGYDHQANTHFEVMLVTVAASVTAGSESTAGIGGAINVISSSSKANATVGSGASVVADDDLSIKSKALGDLLLVSLSVAAGKAKTAVGGTIAVVVDKSSARTNVGDGSTLQSNEGSVLLSSENKENAINVLASASAAPSSKVGVAATVGVLVSKTEALTQAGDSVKLIAAKDVSVLSDSKASLIEAAAAVTVGGKSVSVGATILVNVLKRKADASIGQNAAIAAENGNVLVQTTGEDQNIIIGLAAAVGQGTSIAGTIPVVVSNTSVTSSVGANSSITAGDSVAILSDLQNGLYLIAGGVSVSTSKLGIGATVGTTVLNYTVESYLGANTNVRSYVRSGGSGIESAANRSGKRRGVIVGAYGNETVVAAGVAAGVGSNLAVSGTIMTLVVSNKVKATVDENAVIVIAAGDGEGEEGEEGDLAAGAEDHSFVFGFAGALAASSKTGVGATIATVVFSKTVEAIVKAQTVKAPGAVEVKALDESDLYLLALGFGAAGNTAVAGDVNVMVYKDTVQAMLGGSVTAGKGVTVQATADNMLVNVAAGIAVSGSTGVSAVALVTYFQSNTLAQVLNNASLTARSGSIAILAASTEFVTADAAGLAASGGTGVSGTADVVVTKLSTRAITGSGVTLTAASGKVTVEAKDTFTFLGVVVTAAVSGGTGIGVAAIVVVAFNGVEAAIGAGNTVTAGANVKVEADSTRTVDTYAVSAAASATSISPSVAVVVAGGKLPQNASGALSDSHFSVGAQVDAAFDNNSHAKEHKPNSVNSDLAPDSQKAEDLKPSGGWNNYGQNNGDFGAGASNINAESDPESSANQNDKTDFSGGLESDTSVSGINWSMSRNGSDSASASIGAGSAVTAGGAIEVLSNDLLKSDLISGGIAVGGTGVGVGIAVAVLYSNVSAEVGANAALSAGGKITVSASTGSKARSGDPFASGSEASQSRGRVLDALNDKGVGTGGGTVRVIGVSGAAGGTAVAATVAVLLVFSEVNAVMNGSVVRASSVEVLGGMNFGQVLTVTLGLGAGGTGIAASVALSYFSGKVNTYVGPNARIAAADGGKITVSELKVVTTGVANVISVATALAGGGVGVAAGVALAFNKTTVNTYVARSAVVNISGAVNAKTDFTANTTVFTISLAFGSVAVGATVAVACNSQKVYTYIGYSPLYINANGTVGSPTGGVGSITASNVTVYNNVDGVIRVLGFGVSGGAIAANGIVALAFNDVDSRTAINGVSMNANAVKAWSTVNTLTNGGALPFGLVDVNANTAVILTAVTAGGVAAGAAVGICKVTAKSYNIVSVDGGTMKLGTLTVGEGDCNSKAFLSIVSGQAGGVAAAINVAIALNKADYQSILTGRAGGSLEATTVKLVMNGNASSFAVVANAAGGGIAANASVALAKLAAVQKALVTGSGTVKVGTITVTSTQNVTDPSLTFTLHVGGPVGDISQSFNQMAQAFIFNGALAGTAISANVSIAIADATCWAELGGGDLTVTTTATVNARANTKSDATVYELGASVTGIGARVVYSYAIGTVKAILSSIGNSNAVNVQLPGGLTVSVEYLAKANAVVSPSLGGLLLDVGANVAIARVKTKSVAGVEGSGVISAGNGNVIISNKGTVSSNAEIKATLISGGVIGVGASFVFSKLEAQQLAYVQGSTVKAANLTVKNNYNVSGDSATRASDTGATAKVGASLVQVEALSVKANVGFAKSGSTVRAYIGNGGTDLTGTLTIVTYANSYAECVVEAPTVSVGGISAGVTYVNAHASGSYEAGIDSGNSSNTIKAKDVDIRTVYRTDSYAATGPQGGVGVSVASINVNVARAYANSDASAYVKGGGGAVITGNLSVKIDGNGEAKARVFSNDVNVSMVNVAANALYANQEARQHAYTDISGNVTVNGNVTIDSVFTGTADTQVGNAKGAQVSLIQGGLNIAESYAAATNEAYLGGNSGGIFTVKNGSVSIRAKSDTTAKAVALAPLNIGLAKMAGQIARSSTSDSTEARLGNGGSFTLDVENGGITVDAIGETESYSECASGPSVSALSITAGDLRAYIGSTSGRAQTVKATVANAAQVYANGNISISALNQGSVKARMTKGFDVSLVSGSSNNVITESRYNTETGVGNGAHLESRKGSISLKAEDKPSADALVDGNGVGMLLSADSKKARNYLTENVYATIGNNAEVIAYGDLSVSALSNKTSIDTRTHANTGGLFASGSLGAETSLNRTVRLSANSNALLKSHTANLSLIAEGGRQDSISTTASGNSAGLVGIGGARAYCTISNSVTTELTGAKLYADYGTVNVFAHVAEGNVNTVGDFGAAGLIGSPRSYANSNSITLKADTILKNGTLVRGTYVNIAAALKELRTSNRSVAKVKGAGGAAWATSDVKLYLPIAVTVNNADVQAYVKGSLWSSAKPSNSGTQVTVRAETELKGLAGYIDSEVTLDGYFRSDLNVTNSRFKGYGFEFNSYGFSGNINCGTSARRKGMFVVKDEDTNNRIDRGSGTMNISSNSFDLSGAALPIRAELDINGRIWTAGSAGTLSSSASNGKATVNGKIRPFGAGSLYAPNANLSGNTITASKTYVVEFENYFEGEAILPAMDLTISDSEFGTVRITGKNVPGVSYGGSATGKIYVNNYNGGDVRFGNVIVNENGDLIITWIGESGNLLDSLISSDVNHSPVWTHTLTVTNVNNIGSSMNTYPASELVASGSQELNTYFQVLMTRRGNEDPSITIQANGNVYLQPVLTAVTRQPTLTAPDASTVEGSVVINEIKAGGLVDIAFSPELLLNYMASAGGTYIESIDFEPVFLPDSVEVESVTLSGSGLERYKTGEANGEITYTLPDGSTVVMKDGKVLSINGYTGYQLVPGHANWIILEAEVLEDSSTAYVYFDMSSHELVVQANYPNAYEVFFDTKSQEILPGISIPTGEYIVESGLFKYPNGYDVDINSGGGFATGSLSEDLRVSGDVRSSLLGKSLISSALSGGAFGNYNSSDFIDRVYIYRLGSTTYAVTFDDIEYLGIFGYHTGQEEDGKDEQGNPKYKSVTRFYKLDDPGSPQSDDGFTVYHSTYSVYVGKNDDGEDQYENIPCIYVGNSYRFTTSSDVPYLRLGTAVFGLSVDSNDDGTALSASAEITANGVERRIKLKEHDGEYRISKTVAITTDGTIKSVYGNVTVESNPGSGTLAYIYKATPTATVSSAVKFKNGAVTLVNRELSREQITSTVAKDATGTYWYNTGSSWVSLGTPDGSGNLKYNGTTVLTVGGDYVILYRDGVQRFKIYSNGTKEQLFSEPKTIRTKYASADDTNDFTVGYIGSGVGHTGDPQDPVNREIWLWFDDGKYLIRGGTRQNGTNIQSAGNVYQTSGEESTELQMGTPGQTVSYNYGVYNGNEYQLVSWNEQGDNVIKGTNFWEAEPGQPFKFLPNTVVKPDSFVSVITHGGDILSTGLTIGTGAIVILDANVKDDAGGNVILDGDTIVNGATLQITAHKGIKIPYLVASGSTLDMLAYDGELEGTTWIVENGTELTATINGDIILDQGDDHDPVNQPLTVTGGSTVTLISTGGGLYRANAQAKDKTQKVNDDSDNRQWYIEGAEVFAQVRDNLVLPKLIVKDTAERAGIATLESTEANLLFDRVESNCYVTLAAGKSIIVYHTTLRGEDNHPIIVFHDRDYEGERYENGQFVHADDHDTDANSSLTLRAGENIGEIGRWLYLDVPEALTPVIQLVTDFYIDAQARTVLDWDVYKYWVGNGHGVEKVNVAFDNQTRLDYLSYSDLQFFYSLLDIADNGDLAAWIAQRANDSQVNTANKTNNWYESYTQIDQSFAELLTGLARNEIQQKNINAILNTDLLGSSVLTETVKAAIAAAKAEKKANHEDFTLDDQIDVINDTVDSFLKGTSGTDAEALKVLKTLLDLGLVTNGTSLYSLVNYLFQKSSLYESDYQELLERARDEGDLSKAKAEAAKAANGEALAATISSCNELLTASMDAKAALIDGIVEAMALKTSVTQALRTQAEKDAKNSNGAYTADERYLELLSEKIAAGKLPTAEAYDNVYLSVMDAYAAYDAALTASVTEEDVTNAENALKQALTATLQTLKTYSGYASKVEQRTSVQKLTALVKDLRDARSGYSEDFDTALELRANDRALTQRYWETADSYSTEMSAVEVARRLDVILSANGEWDAAVDELAAAKAALTEAIDAYEALQASYDIQGQATSTEALQAKADAVNAARASYFEADQKVADLYAEIYELCNTHYDQEGRDVNLVIGEMYGSAYLYNTDSISITVDPTKAYDTLYTSVQNRAEAGEITLNADHSSDITVANIRSERGDVKIVNLGGSILAADLTADKQAEQEWIYRNDGVSYAGAYTDGAWATMPVAADDFMDSDFARSRFTTGEHADTLVKNFEQVHIYCGNLTLDAFNSVGSAEQVFQVETRASVPTKVANVSSTDMDPYLTGTVYRRYEDVVYSIYDQLVNNGVPANYFDTLLVMFQDYSGDAALDVLGADRWRSGLRLDTAATENVQTVLDGKDLSGILVSGVQYPNRELLAEITFTDAEGNTYVGYGLQHVSVRHDWVRVPVLEQGMNVVLAGRNGDVYYNEVNGDIAHAEITAGGNAVVSAQNGEREIGSEDDRIQVEVGGELTLGNSNETYVEATGDLVLNGTTPNTHYEIDGTGSVTLRDTDETGESDVLSGYVHAVGAVTVRTDKDIGTDDESFDLSTGGTVAAVSFQGKNAYLSDSNPDDVFVVTDSVVDGNLVLDTQGGAVGTTDSLYDSDLETLLERQQAYNEAKNRLSEAEALQSSILNLNIAEALDEAIQQLNNAQQNAADAHDALEQAKADLNTAKETYRQAVKDGEDADALDEKLLQIQSAEQTLAEKQAEAQAADSELKQAQADADALQHYWDGMQDYPTRQLEEAKKVYDEAKAALEAARAAYDKAVAARDALVQSGASAEKIQQAQNAVDNAAAVLPGLEQAEQAAKAYYENAVPAELNALLSYADAQVAAAQAEVDRTGEELDNALTVMQALTQLNEAQKAQQQAQEALEADPDDAVLQAEAEMAANRLEACEAIYEAACAVIAVENGSDEQKAQQQQTLAEAQRILEAIERAENFVANGDEAFAAASGIDADASESEKLAAALEQQAYALEVLRAVELVHQAESQDDEHKQQAATTLSAAREQFEAAEQAYAEQAAQIEAQKARDEAEATLAEAQEAWDKLKQQEYPNKTDEQILANVLSNNKVKEARLALLNAEQAFADAVAALDAQTLVTDDAMQTLEEKSESMDAIDATNAAIAAEDARLEALEQANAEKAELDDAAEAAVTATGAAKDALSNSIDALSALLGNETDADEVLKDSLAAFKASLTPTRSNNTSSTDTLDVLAEQLEHRLNETSTTTADEFKAALTAVNDDLRDYYAARVAENEAKRAVEEKQAEIDALNDQAAGNADAINEAKTAQSDVLGRNGTPTADSSVGIATDNLGNGASTVPDLDVSGNATVSTGGDFGTQSDVLSAKIDGTLDLVSGGGIGIGSGDDLNVIRALGQDDAVLTTTGSINNVSGGKDPMISGQQVILNAVTGSDDQPGGSNVGSADKPLVIDATGLGGTADNFYVSNTNTGNTELSDLTARENAEISLGGGATQEVGTVVAAENLTINGSGAIGSVPANPGVTPVYTDGISTPVSYEQPEGSIAVNAGNVTVSGTEANLFSLNPDATVAVNAPTGIVITALGNISLNGSALNGSPIAIAAMGSIGSVNGDVFVGNGRVLYAETVYGKVFITRSVNSATALTFLVDEHGAALGLMSPRAVLIISDLKLTAKTSAETLLDSAHTSAFALSSYNVTILNTDGSRYTGKVMLMLEVEGLENGTVVYVLHSRDGQLEFLKAFVWEGYAVFVTDGLSAGDDSHFVVLTEEGLAELGLNADDAGDKSLCAEDIVIGGVAAFAGNTHFLSDLVRIIELENSTGSTVAA